MYTKTQIKEVMTLAKTGMTRTQIAKKTKMNLASVHYYTTRRAKRLTKRAITTQTPRPQWKEQARFILLEIAKALK